MSTAPSTASVLIVEDAGTRTESILAKLQAQGEFALAWERVDTLSAFREALDRHQDWQLVVSDTEVSGVDTVQAFALAREIAPTVPFVVVSRGRREVIVERVVRQWLAHPARERTRPGGAQRSNRFPTADNPESRVSPTQLFDFARRLLEAQEAERRHIARELHDEFGQLLTAVRLNLETAQHHQGAIGAAAIQEAMTAVGRAIEQVRNFSSELWPTVLDDLGLGAALRWLVENQPRAANLDFHLNVGSLPRLPHTIEVTCFRVVQESLTNILRHAGARRVDLAIAVSGATLSLQVKDDGVAFDVEAVRQRATHGGPPSFGLLGMQERVLMAGGQFDIQSTAGEGTTVRARFPLGAEIPS